MLSSRTGWGFGGTKSVAGLRLRPRLGFPRYADGAHQNENPASSLSTRYRVFGKSQKTSDYFSMTILRTSLYEPAVIRTK